MLSETERDALEDIRDNIARVMRFVDGFDLDNFIADDKTFYAATRCLEIISEATRRLSPSFKARFPEIAWKDAAGSGSIYRIIMRTSKSAAFGRQFTTPCPRFAPWWRPRYATNDLRLRPAFLRTELAVTGGRRNYVSL